MEPSKPGKAEETKERAAKPEEARDEVGARGEVGAGPGPCCSPDPVAVIPGAAEVHQVRAEEGRQNQLPEEGRHRALLVHGQAAGRDGLRHQRADG